MCFHRTYHNESSFPQCALLKNELHGQCALQDPLVFLFFIEGIFVLYNEIYIFVIYYQWHYIQKCDIVYQHSSYIHEKKTCFLLEVTWNDFVF